MTTPFYKYEGCGNDFALFSASDISLEALLPLIARLCDRHRGIGADGVIFLTAQRKISDVQFFNSDGSYAAFCGNGMRCTARHLLTLFPEEKKFSIKSGGITYAAEQYEKDVAVQLFASPLSDPFYSPLLPDMTLYTIDVGVPHLVALSQKIEDLDVNALGKAVNAELLLKGLSYNINFACRSGGSLNVRTYERGVNAETEACGSGAAAASIAAGYHWQLSSPITAITSGGCPLYYHFSLDHKTPCSLLMRGAAHLSFHGFIHLPL